jgi:uncharacterized membrane protein
MFTIPPLPGYDGLHPLIVHFPIALLFTAPVLIVLGMLLKKGRAFSVAALVLMLLGTGSMFLALSTGEAAEGQADAVAGAKGVLDQHEDLAETARNVFLGLTGVFMVLLIAAGVLGTRFSRRALVISSALFLFPYLGGMLVLANTAHQGGRLVHELGVRAPMASATPPGQPPGAPAGRGEEETDRD